MENEELLKKIKAKYEIIVGLLEINKNMLDDLERAAKFIEEMHAKFAKISSEVGETIRNKDKKSRILG